MKKEWISQAIWTGSRRAQRTCFILGHKTCPPLSESLLSVRGGSVPSALHFSPEALGSYKLQSFSRQLLECPLPTAQEVAWPPEIPEALPLPMGRFIKHLTYFNIYIYFFLMWTIFKVVIEFVTILLLLFMFWLFISHWVCGILVPWPGIEPPALKGELLTIRLPRKSHACLLKTKNDGEATDTRVLKVMSNFFGKYMMLGSAVSLPTPCYRNKNWDLE